MKLPLLYQVDGFTGRIFGGNPAAVVMVDDWLPGSALMRSLPKKRDPQMHQTRKGKQWYFGMKVHTGVDTDSGLVHTVRGTAANVADVNVLGELLHGGEESLHGDSAYHSKELKALTEASGIAFNVNAPPADAGAEGA